MIAYIEGKLTYKDPTYVIIDIGGMGYQVKISLQTYSALKNKDQFKLFTYLHIKEDAHTLYGFSEKAEKDHFLNLISVSGVGPGTGLLILSSLSTAELRQSIINEEVKIIQKIKGIGGKTAQRIILELKDKMMKAGIPENEPNLPRSAHNTLKEEALSALTTLGINKVTAEKNIDHVLKSMGSDISLEELIKFALK